MSHWRTIRHPSCMCIASARHEQLERDKVVSKRSSWHRRSNLFATNAMSRIGMLNLPGHPIRWEEFCFKHKEKTRITAGSFDRNIPHGLQQGVREGNTKHKNSARNHVHRPTMSNQMVSSSRRQKRTKSEGALYKHGILHRKNPTTSATKLIGAHHSSPTELGKK